MHWQFYNKDYNFEVLKQQLPSDFAKALFESNVCHSRLDLPSWAVPSPLCQPFKFQY